jgi:hypothetical protein
VNLTSVDILLFVSGRGSNCSDCHKLDGATRGISSETARKAFSNACTPHMSFMFGKIISVFVLWLMCRILGGVSVNNKN